MSARLPRDLHPVAWWLWAIGLAVAASLTTNPYLLLLLVGTATLALEWLDPTAQALVLDTRDLQITKVEVGDGTAWRPARFALAKRDPRYGSKLTVQAARAPKVRIAYRTSPAASSPTRSANRRARVSTGWKSTATSTAAANESAELLEVSTRAPTPPTTSAYTTTKKTASTATTTALRITTSMS